MKLIIGLGNPEPKYQFTPHNLGFLVVTSLAEECDIEINKRKFRSLWGEGVVGSEEILLVLPHTYVNLSGPAVASLAKWRKLNLKDLLVVCDDVNLPLGRIRIRPQGSDGGHKGLQSIVYSLGSEMFSRLRIGVGAGEKAPSLQGEEDLAEYVLRPFTKKKLKAVRCSIERATEACRVWAIEGIATAMNIFNPPSDTEEFH